MTDNKEAYSKAGGKGKLSFKGVKAPKKQPRRVIDEDLREVVKVSSKEPSIAKPPAEEIKILLGRF
jgi:hypothetical protein